MSKEMDRPQMGVRERTGTRFRVAWFGRSGMAEPYKPYENPPHPDVKDLEQALKERIEGEVRFDDGSRALYATDASNYRRVPIGVVIPRSAEDVINAMAVCREHRAPIVSRGGGTSLAGQCCNLAVVFDFSKSMNQVIQVDPERKLATVQPGLIRDHLDAHTLRYKLAFGPDPATHNRCTFGGMIGNNSCGTHAQMAGKTSDNTHELDVLLYDGTRLKVGETSDEEVRRIIAEGGRRGEIYAKLVAFRDRYANAIRARYPNIPRLVSGYSLEYLLPENGFHIARALVGSENTLVTVLEATMNLVHSPPYRALLVLGYPSIYEAGDHVPLILPFKPTALEGLDHLLIDFNEKKGSKQQEIQMLPEGKGWLLVEMGGESQEEANHMAGLLARALKATRNAPSIKLFEARMEETEIWDLRESGLGATAFVPGMPDAWPGWEDSAVPPDRVGDYLRALRKLYDKYGYEPSLYGHFGQGCIHCRVQFDLKTANGLEQWRKFMEEATDLVVSYGGSLSGEHGDGSARSEFLPKMYGPEIMQAFAEFKAIWDPDGKMNPGNIVNPYGFQDHLRMGQDYEPKAVTTYFKYPEDRGSFAHATERCVGVGKCRRHEGGTMCPSYLVTHEEKHTTRGRAHLLFEMLQGNPISKGWKSPEVKEALDLCLACKGCKGECPVNVDMATYKAEFLAHHYQGRLRPRAAYAFGWIAYWARIGSRFPHLVNFVSQTPGLSRVAKLVAGMAPERQIPKFATMTFKEWFFAREVKNEGKPKVILWPDTFVNHFEPEIGKATVEVLELAGFQVMVPGGNLCCGRPLYDHGFLGMAQRWLLRIIDELAPLIQQGVPMVGMEPSCVAVFRDELILLFPHDENAARLASQTLTLAEFLDKHASEFQVPKLLRKALVQPHCHHKAIMGLKSEQQVLKQMGLDFEVLESAGCCGMAGSFGFEAGDKYEVSVAEGERVLLPTVREAPKDALVMADGFSCRMQIGQETERKALHLAQAMQLALDEGPRGPSGNFPEREFLVRNRIARQGPTPAETALLAGTVALAVGAVALALLGSRRADLVRGRRR